MTKRIHATEKTKALIEELSKMHGPLMFHQSGGCCDGSAPMCFTRGELMIDNSDVCLGYLHGVPFYMAKDQFEYWKHTELTIDVIQGRGASFSLEIPLGLRFIVKSRLFSDVELMTLEPLVA